MGTRDGLHPVIPADFCERWDAETPQEALAKAEQAPTSTTGPRDRCPYCGSVKIRTKTSKPGGGPQRPENHACMNCKRHFDETADETTIPMTDNRTDAFEWIDEPSDADERGFTAVLRGVDDERPTEIVL